MNDEPVDKPIRKFSYDKMKPILALRQIVERISNKENMVVCEVGCFDAITTFCYADIVKKYNGTIFLIDWFFGSAGTPEHYHGWRPEQQEQLYTHVMTKIIKQDLHNTITVIIGDSKESAAYIPDNYLDICFLDADHRYDDTNKNIKAYLPKIKAGGILCGHDCEDIRLANTFPDNALNVDYYRGRHAGVIQAVYDNFGYEIEKVLDPQGQGVPLWLKQL